jgi:RNA polymerase sigma-70 factor (ECF subfamily)
MSPFVPLRVRSHGSLLHGTASPEALVERAEARATVWAALGRLTARERAVVVLRYFVGLDVAGSADRLGLPEGTVKRRLHDARRRLRALLAPTRAAEDA